MEEEELPKRICVEGKRLQTLSPIDKYVLLGKDTTEFVIG